MLNFSLNNRILKSISRGANFFLQNQIEKKLIILKVFENEKYNFIDSVRVFIRNIIE